METREIWTLEVTPEQMGFCGAAQGARIRRHFVNLPSGTESDETVLSITGISPSAEAQANAEALLKVARDHWAIENANHYVRDRSYDEDRCQVRDPNSAQILATLRSLARFLAQLGIHRPRNLHQRTTPAFNRFCQAHRNQALGWLISARGCR